jgi:hypothetical protein
MSDKFTPITPDSPLCQTVHCLSEKFVVDFANGIDVARDHLRVQRERTGLFARMYDGFTGQAARRQTEITASLAEGVEASLKWLCELSESLAHSHLAITQVNDRVTALTDNVTRVAHYSTDTRKRLETLAHRLDARMHDMAQEIVRIDFIQKAQLNVDAIFSKWAAGHFAALSPAARCYVALEELRWGALGDYCRSSHNTSRQCRDFLQLVADRATQQLAADAAVGLQSPVNMIDVWLEQPVMKSNGDHDMREALVYLADGMVADAAPFVISATQHPACLPLAVPRIAQARRVAEGMLQEVFVKEVIDV